MFSSGLSLRNNIKEVDIQLTAYSINNNARVVILETFKTNLEGTGEGSIQDLINKHDSQAASISLEASSRATADSNLGEKIDNEIVNRGQAISGEAASRGQDISKVGFISTAEAEGILEVGSYPFCFGMENQSDLNYGLPLPFSYTLQSIAYTSIATTTNHSIIFNIVHYPFNTNEGPTILQNSVAVSGEYTIVSIKAVAPSAGNLVVEIVSSQNLTDDNGKYRLSFI